MVWVFKCLGSRDGDGQRKSLAKDFRAFKNPHHYENYKKQNHPFEWFYF